MKWFDVTSGSLGPKLVRALCSILPRNQAYQLGDRLVPYVLNQNETGLVQDLQSNIAVVYGLPEDHPRVRSALQQQFRNLVRSYVDLFKAIEQGTQGVYASCEFDQGLLDIVNTCLDSGRGLLLVGIHSCSFDLLLLALTQYFPQVQALTKSDPKGSSTVMNGIREKFGVRVTPISVQALREAIQRLNSGGVVVIAADVPVENCADLIFFRRKTCLPSGHARLAMKTNAQMIAGASLRVSDGLYRAVGVQSHQPPLTENRAMDETRWAQHTLFLLERFIRERPHEWFMPVALWPSSSDMGIQASRLPSSIAVDQGKLSVIKHVSNNAQAKQI